MYNVSNSFNDNIKSIVRNINCKVLINNEDKTLASISIVIDRKNQNTNNIIGNAVPQKLTLTLTNYSSEHSFIGDKIDISFGCLIDDTYEYVPMPTFYAESAVYNQESKQWVVTAYDNLYFLNNYSINEIIVEYPCTRLNYLNTVCALSGLKLGSTDFLGNNILLNSAPNFDDNISVLNAVSAMAECSLCNAFIGRDNKLYFKQIIQPTYTKTEILPIGLYYFTIGDVNIGFEITEQTENISYNPITNLINNSIVTEYITDTIEYTQITDLTYNSNITSNFTLTNTINNVMRSNYTKAQIKSHYGKVNTVVLSRGDVEDNVYLEDDESINLNGKTEFTITNNPFIDYGSTTDNRYDLISNLFCVLNNFECNAYTLEFRGNPALDCYDYITFLDCYNQEKSHTEIFIGDKITYKTKVYQAETEFNAISQDEIDKTKALSIKDVISNTQIIVDKVNKQINAVISSIDEVNNNIVTLSNVVKSNNKQTDITISMTGGNNLLRNSAFYKDIEYWNISENTQYEILQDTHATNNTESGSIFILKNGSISQNFNTAIGETYTFSCLLKNSNSTNEKKTYIRIYINDTDYIEIYNNTQYTDLSNITFSYTASVNNPKLTIHTNNTDLEIADLRVVKGNISQAWSQHSEEIYGKGILIDNSGVEVRSLAGETVTTKLDNDSLLIKKNNSIVTEVSDERIQSNLLISNNILKIGDVVFEEVENGRIFVYKET